MSKASFHWEDPFLLDQQLTEEERIITLKISTSALRTINKKGISACIKEAREKGFIK